MKENEEEKVNEEINEDVEMVELSEEEENDVEGGKKSSVPKGTISKCFMFTPHTNYSHVQFTPSDLGMESNGKSAFDLTALQISGLVVTIGDTIVGKTPGNGVDFYYEIDTSVVSKISIRLYKSHRCKLNGDQEIKVNGEPIGMLHKETVYIYPKQK